MTVSRRRFLSTAAAASCISAVPISYSAAAPKVLRAMPGTAQLAPAGQPETAIWGYDGRVPGPTLRLAQGERLVRRFVNGLAQPSTVHWHGIRIANAMDGVPDMTQDVVPVDGDFLYDFVVPDAGTYWYHPHNRTWEQMARGLYGALIVDEPAPPAVDRDEVLLIDDWRLAADASLHDSFGDATDWADLGRLGDLITVNGAANFRLPARHRERLRLRLVNTANARFFTLRLEGLTGWIVALDGQPLAKPVPAERIILASAQRADLIVDVTGAPGAQAYVVAVLNDASRAIVTLDIGGEARSTPLPAPAPLPANPVAALGPLQSARQVSLLMEGGAKGAMAGASVDGRLLSLSQLAKIGRYWSLNGVADIPDEPLMTAALGETVRIKIINDTSTHHAMHLHGHHFRKVEADGTTGPLRDTLLMRHRETAEIAFVADNPGDWLLHCHMLEHAASGMMTWLRVAG